MRDEDGYGEEEGEEASTEGQEIAGNPAATSFAHARMNRMQCVADLEKRISGMSGAVSGLLPVVGGWTGRYPLMAEFSSFKGVGVRSAEVCWE